MASAGGFRWWLRLVASAGGIGWWPRLVASAGGIGCCLVYGNDTLHSAILLTCIKR